METAHRKEQPTIHYLFPKLYAHILHRHINISYEAARRLIDTANMRGAKIHCTTTGGIYPTAEITLNTTILRVRRTKYAIDLLDHSTSNPKEALLQGCVDFTHILARIDTYLDHQEAIARQWWHIN